MLTPTAIEEKDFAAYLLAKGYEFLGTGVKSNTYVTTLFDLREANLEELRQLYLNDDLVPARTFADCLERIRQVVYQKRMELKGGQAHA